MRLTLFHKLVVLFLGLLSNVLRVTTELYTSTAHLEEIMAIERDLYPALQNYIEEENIKLGRLKVAAQNLRNASFAPAGWTESNHARTPFLAYVFLKKFKEKWDSVSEVLNMKTHRNVLTQKIANHSHSFPTWEDFEGIRDALFRIQSVYKLKAAQLAKGLFDGSPTSPVYLSPMDTYLVGRRAYTSMDLNRTKEWMEETLNLMGTRDAVQGLAQTVTKSSVLDHLAFVYYQLGNWRNSADFYQNMVDRNPQDLKAKDNLQRVLRKLTGPPSAVLSTSASREHKNMVHYATLCRTHDQRAEDKAQHLTCQILNTHPGLVLKPVAMEILSIKPYIVFFHNVLSEMEIEELINLAKPKLKRATVSNLGTGKKEVVEFRISKTAWLRDHENDVIMRINRRIEALTGLTGDTAEMMQVNNYGVGGQYEPHFDHAVDMGKSPIAALKTGNRIATLMFYLSEVEVGGATVFVKAGIRVVPNKGGAVFWYNLKKSGAGDWDTLHAGCPVIIGNKWVANKWFHEHGQEFRRPCGLQPDE